jgi:hypothetical protein
MHTGRYVSYWKTIAIQFWMEIPLAITGSNRTELITKSTIGAQVGISYDFDSLFAK